MEAPKKRPTARAQQSYHIGRRIPARPSRRSRWFGANALCGSTRGRSCNTPSTIQARPARIQAPQTKRRSTEAAARKQSRAGSECGLLQIISSEPSAIIRLREANCQLRYYILLPLDPWWDRRFRLSSVALWGRMESCGRLLIGLLGSSATYARPWLMQFHIDSEMPGDLRSPEKQRKLRDVLNPRLR
jgi:hypothetical protein